MQQNHAVFGELDHYDSEPFKCTSAYSIHCNNGCFVYTFKGVLTTMNTKLLWGVLEHPGTQSDPWSEGRSADGWRG